MIPQAHRCAGAAGRAGSAAAAAAAAAAAPVAAAAAAAAAARQQRHPPAPSALWAAQHALAAGQHQQRQRGQQQPWQGAAGRPLRCTRRRAGGAAEQQQQHSDNQPEEGGSGCGSATSDPATVAPALLGDPTACWPPVAGADRSGRGSADSGASAALGADGEASSEWDPARAPAESPGSANGAPSDRSSSAASSCSSTEDDGDGQPPARRAAPAAAEGRRQQRHHRQQQRRRQQEQPSAPPWPPDVPWGLGKVGQVMGLWLLAYITVGQLLVPGLLAALDVDHARLSARGAALLNLGLDVGQVAITLAILAACLGRYRPRRRGLFRFAWQRGDWLGWVAAGAACFPLVDWLAHSSVVLLSGSDAPADTDVWTAQIESGLYDRDWLTCAAYVVVVSLCAPLWEEAIFRGFLLPSLAKHLAPPAASLASALLFALCHFRAETFAPLLLLGLVFGGLYTRCNNLLPPMVLHSLWNMYVLGGLVLRMRSGCSAVEASVVLALGTQLLLLLSSQLLRWRRSSGGGGECGGSERGGSERGGGGAPSPEAQGV